MAARFAAGAQVARAVPPDVDPNQCRTVTRPAVGGVPQAKKGT